VVVIKTEFGSESVQLKRGSGCASCFSSLFILALILGIAGGVIWFRFPEIANQILAQAQLAELSTKIANSVSVSQINQLMLAPNSNDSPPDIVTFAYGPTRSDPTLTYLNTLNSTIRWQSQPLKEWTQAKVLVTPNLLYITDATSLIAFNRADGAIAWQTSMADKLKSGCTACLLIIQARVVALLQGGTVQSFEAKTGQLKLSQRLNFEPVGRIAAAGEQLLIFDRTQDNLSGLMYVVNPSNDTVVNEVILPGCDDRLIDLSNPQAYHPQRNELYLLDGDIIGPACLQVWNVAGQQISRQVIFDGISLPSDFSNFLSDQSKLLLAGDFLYFSAARDRRQGEENIIIRVNPADGQWAVVAQAPDYKLTALAMIDNTLIVRATRSRGTARDELWGVDGATAEPRWQYVLQAKRWHQEPGAGSAWDWRRTPHGLAVLQLFEDPDQLTLEILNPQTGVSGGQRNISVKDTFLSGIVWSNNMVWVALRHLYAIDLQSQKLAYTWP
jgi:hypothetical protein